MATSSHDEIAHLAFDLGSALSDLAVAGVVVIEGGPAGDQVRLTIDGQDHRVAVRHDLADAPLADTRFVAHARQDARTVLDAFAGRRVEREDLLAIKRRADEATAGPWICYLEVDGGLGGSNVILMPEGPGPDMYVFQDGALAPDPEWRFLEVARTALPLLASYLARD